MSSLLALSLNHPATTGSSADLKIKIAAALGVRKFVELRTRSYHIRCTFGEAKQLHFWIGPRSNNLISYPCLCNPF